MPILLSDEEIQAMEGLPHLHRCLYIFGIRKHMDYHTGITGIKRKISYKSLSEEVYIIPHQGHEKSGAPSHDQVKRTLKRLEKVGLITIHSKVAMHEKQLILKCILASWDKSVQNKPALNPPCSPALEAALESEKHGNKENPYKNSDINDIGQVGASASESKSRPASRPDDFEKPARHPVSDIDKIGYDQRQQYFDLLSQRRFPTAYLADPRTNAMLEAWLFGNITTEEASKAMQHADAQKAATQERVSRPWYYQDIPFQFRAALDAAKQQTQEIKTHAPTTTRQSARKLTSEQLRERRKQWALRRKQEEEQEEDGCDDD